jgi:hypothetical protein
MTMWFRYLHANLLPTRFIDSEADLDSAIKSLLPLAQNPTIAYPELVKSGTVTLLVGLLSHENADIVIDVVELIHELTDEDVGDEDAEGGEEGVAEALKLLIDGLVCIHPWVLCVYSSPATPSLNIPFSSCCQTTSRV